MRVPLFVAVLGSVVAFHVPSIHAQTLVNPDVSAVGDMRINFRTGETAEGLGVKEIEFEFHELELDFNGYLNPYMRADAFVGIHGTHGEVEVEEASITVLRGLPLGLQLKAGKYLLDFGRINTQHPHQWGWIEWPLMHRTMLSEEGLWPVGAQLSTLRPLGETAVRLSVNAFMSDAFAHEHHHEAADEEEQDETAPAEIMGSARLSFFRSFTDAWSAELGASYLAGRYDPADDLDVGLTGIDWKLKWRPDTYRAFIWTIEAMRSDREVIHAHEAPDTSDHEHQAETIEAFGAFSAAELHFRRVWDVGAYFDYTQDANVDDVETTAFGTWFGYMPAEETARFSLVYRRETSDNYEFDVNSVILQIVWALGPHKPHAF